jgi:hypothetical protein
MPGFVAAYVALFAAAGTAAIVYAVVYVVVLAVEIAALSYVSRLLRHGPSATSSGINPGQVLTSRNSIAPRQIIYGQVRTGGVLVFAMSSGSDNKYLHLLVAYAGHECDSVSDFWLDNWKLTLDGSGNCTGSTDPQGNSSSKYSGLVRVKNHLGASGQTVDTDLQTDIGSTVWPNSAKLQGICYDYVRLSFDQNTFSGGWPNVSRLIKGKKIYDSRSSTTVWSDNWANCIADFLRDTVVGLGATSAEIDDAILQASANKSDEAVSLTAGGTEPRWTINGMADSSNTPGTVLADMLAAGVGIAPWVGGQFKIIAGAHSSSVQTITLDDATGPITVVTGDSLADTFNAVQGTFISPQNQWQPADFPPVTSSTYQTEDGGRQLWKDIQLPFTSRPATAQRVAKVVLEMSRRDITVQFPGKMTLQNICAGDVVALTIPKYSWSSKLFEVVQAVDSLDTTNKDAPALGIGLLLRSTESTVWSDAADTTVTPVTPTNQYDPFALTAVTPATPTLTSANVTQDGYVIPRIEVDFTASTDQMVLSGGFTHIEYQRDGDSTWKHWSAIRGDLIQDILTDVATGLKTNVRLRYQNVAGVYSSYSATASFIPNTSAVAAPSLDPPGQLFATTITVNATCATSGATLRYTQDGTHVDSSSPAFPGGGLTLTNTAILKVRAFNGGDTSSEVTQQYTLNGTGAKVATPSINLNPHNYATFASTTSATASCATSGSTMRKRINGGSWSAYSGASTLNVGDLYEVQGQKGGLTDSDIASTIYENNV